jgi:hypothetical protein
MGRLGIGTQLVTRAGPAATVVSVKTEKNKEGVKVFNFEIEGQHSYFVGKTSGGLWVHNACEPIPGGIDWGKFAVGLGAAGGKGSGMGGWGRMLEHLEKMYPAGHEVMVAASRFDIRKELEGFAWLMNRAKSIHFNIRGVTEASHITNLEMDWILRNPQVWSKVFIHDL